MSVYKIDFGWSPSGKEASIVVAESPEEAIKMLELEEDYTTYVKVESDPEDQKGSIEYTVTECDLEEGVIFTGHYCC